MASGIAFVCGQCGAEIEAWSDGNPYYLDEHGEKQYAYHPDNERLERCIGNDVPCLCMQCGTQFNNDSRAPTARCHGCGSPDIVEAYELSGRTCPHCKAGVFTIDPKRGFVS